MSYREHGMWEVLEVLRRHGRGEKTATIARGTGHSRFTVRRYVRLAKANGWTPAQGEPTESLAAAVLKQLRPGPREPPADTPSVEQHLLPHLDDGALDDLVFQCGNTQRPLPPVRLLDVRPTYRLGSVRSPFEPLGEVLQMVSELLAVVLPRLPINSWRGLSLQCVVGPAQPLDGVHMVQERSEPQLPLPPCGVSYPVERAARTFPALCPEHGTLVRVSLGHRPSLRHLRGWFRSVVRQLLWYYGGVRLPVTVHHRIASLDFPMRPGVTCSPGGWRDLPVPVQGVSVHAQGLRPRRVRQPLAIARLALLPSANQ